MHSSIAAVAGTVVLASIVLIIVTWAFSRLRKGQEARSQRRRLLSVSVRQSRGDFVGAAEEQMRVRNWREASQLFVSAGQPVRAAMALLQDGDRKGAAGLLERAGELVRAADLLLEMGQQEQAAKCLARSSDAAQQRRAADLFALCEHFVAAGQIYEALGDPVKAASLYLKAPGVLAEPDRPARLLHQAANALGDDPSKSEKKMSLLTAAADAYEKAGAWEQAAELFKHVKQPLRAGQAYERNRQYSYAAELYLAAGAEPEAERLRQIAGGEQALRRARYRLARARGDILSAAGLSAESGDFVVAIQLLREAVRDRDVDQESVEVFYRLADALEHTGESPEAREIYSRLDAEYPGYRDVSSRLVRLAPSRAETAALPPETTGDPASPFETMAPSETSGQHSLDGIPDAGERFEVLEELGRGGMAVVFKARDRILGRTVALKFLPEGSGKSKLAEAFRREATAAAALNHKGIVTIFDVGSHRGREYISMEYVEGTTLEQILDERKGRFSIFEMIDIVEPVLEALAYAHSRGVVHRDIKPSNIMKSTDGGVRIMDFGLAKNMARGKKTTVVAGTPAYMAPEQFSGRGVDHRTDVFAVGATIYELLCGRTPYEEEDSIRVPEGEIPPPRQINPAIPRRLSDAVMKCLAYDPSMRFQSAAELKTELVEVRKQLRAAIEAAMKMEETNDEA